MLVRWALSRYCVPEPRRIPCACVGFDSFSPVVASTDPWYLVYRLAVQLNEQVPGNPPYELTYRTRSSSVTSAAKRSRTTLA
ncbi:MAG: hypothetical protein IT208_15540 [Chthonomonadales bacterium]|nr:hypothetical protein [Chthonomonadales bacterium]